MLRWWKLDLHERATRNLNRPGPRFRLGRSVNKPVTFREPFDQTSR